MGTVQPKTQSAINALTLTFIASLFISSFSIKAQTYPAGFQQVLVANGISSPTVMAFAPDGRLFVAQQTGALRIIENGVLLSTPAITLSVNSSGERGLLGIAFDPNFTSNNFIYLYYTLSSASNNRISRFTMNGNTIVAGSESVVLNLDPLSSATNHNGGTINFGPDGKLYVGVGENANSTNSQNLDTYHGKILRINSDGTVPAGNPFTTGSAQRQRVWEYGMRNPYTLSIQPGTGRIFVNDVGENTWEEVNDCTAGGGNYGWPTAEGVSSNPAFTNPIYTYMHGAGVGFGCAITGGAFFNPSSTNYPSQYIGRYFFLDYCNNWIDMLTLSGSTATRTNFASSIAGFPVGMATGPDGNLYFLSRANSAVYKITFTGSTAPIITTQPQSISVSEGNPASFSVTASGSQPLSYQWRKNTSNISGATNSTYTIPAVSPGDAGNYSVIVSNGAGSAISNDAVLTVTAANQLPTATINTPVAGATYAGGDVINFSGTGTDPEDGNIPASGFEWYVVFHHDAHIHPGPTAPDGVTSGSFLIPNSGETSSNVFYRLYLVVTDSQGGKDTSFTDILPRTSTITLNTNPQGLQITLDGQPFTAPLTVTSVEGMLRTIGAPSPQGIYSFSNWSQGGTATQTFATPVNDVTYTANFTAGTIITLDPIADAYVNGGKNANNNFGPATSLIAQTNSSPNKSFETFLKFDISTISANVSSATLRVNGRLNNTQTPSIAVEAHNVTNTSWLENSITWNNKPAAQPVLASVNVNSTTNQYYQWNLTQLIDDLRNTGINSVAIKLINTNSTNNQVIFNSKEAASNRPELVITDAGGARTALMTQNKNPLIEMDINVYPNPVKNVLTVRTNSGPATLKLYDASGRLVKQQQISGKTLQQVPVDYLKNGLYLLKIENAIGMTTKKIVIQN
ncbi:MAG TPA: PQQ-dependent sugar dehydrogenase [Chitinophagaceae bacterium]|jgi:glucose/arabinose dehydrogenase|nr:PQQ-dependent sugar dehydrogenase [Chitinophagaceae bacterium]